MIKTIRRGAKVRYIGDDELARGRVFRVLHRCGSLVEVMFPVRYLGGEVHLVAILIPLEDFELV